MGDGFKWRRRCCWVWIDVRIADLSSCIGVVIHTDSNSVDDGVSSCLLFDMIHSIKLLMITRRHSFRSTHTRTHSDSVMVVVQVLHRAACWWSWSWFVSCVEKVQLHTATRDWGYRLTWWDTQAGQLLDNSVRPVPGPLLWYVPKSKIIVQRKRERERKNPSHTQNTHLA